MTHVDETDLLIKSGIVLSPKLERFFATASAQEIQNIVPHLLTESKKGPLKKKRVSVFQQKPNGNVATLVGCSRDCDKLSVHKDIALSIFKNKEVSHTVDVHINEDEDGSPQSAQKVFFFPTNDLVVVIEARADVRELFALTALCAKRAKCVANYADKLNELKEKAEEDAERDFLTKLLNKTKREDRYSDLCHDALRHNHNNPTEKTGVGVILFDIDFFKKVNDTYGHHAGDMVLIEMANRFRTHARQTDKIFRDGGEEILALISAKTIEDTKTFAEHLRKAIEAEPFFITYQEKDGTPRERHIKVTCSSGITHIFPKPNEVSNFNDVRNTADMALYEAKHEGGRNCVYTREHIVNHSRPQNNTQQNSSKDQKPKL